MSFFSRSVWTATLCAAVLALQSCSSARVTPNGRRGFFADLSRRGPASVQSGRETGNPVLDKSRENRDEQAQAVAVTSGAMLKKAGLRWPLADVEVTSRFGKRGRDFHEGIDLRAPVGTAIYAAQNGTVLYSGSKIGGYGRMIVLRHSGGLATVYAHASKLLVKTGQKVKVGQKIALSGMSGRSTGPHLHFEVRSGVVAVNPWDYLPNTTLVQGSPDAASETQLASNESGVRGAVPAAVAGAAAVAVGASSAVASDDGRASSKGGSRNPSSLRAGRSTFVSSGSSVRTSSNGSRLAKRSGSGERRVSKLHSDRLPQRRASARGKSVTASRGTASSRGQSVIASRSADSSRAKAAAASRSSASSRGKAAASSRSTASSGAKKQARGKVRSKKSPSVAMGRSHRGAVLARESGH